MNTELSEFIPGFFNLLFEPEDHVRIAVGSPANSVKLIRDEAIQHVLDNGHAPNLWFAAASFRPGSGFTGTDCLKTRAICLDLDYGDKGHKKKSRFDTLEDAYGYLLTLPIEPTCVWHTGHGIQALYLLREPYTFDTPGSLNIYKEAAGKLARMALADSAFTPEHLFRVPLTINAKPDTEPLTGTVLYYNPGKKHSFEEIAQVCARYDIDPEPPEVNPDEEGITVPYDDLPEELRDEIECEYEEGTRSEALFTLVQKLCRSGYSDAVIHAALSRNGSIGDKYGKRLSAEISRCISKARNSSYVYNQRHTPLRLYNDPEEIELSECAELPTELLTCVEKYIAEHALSTRGRILDSARFHEHLCRTMDLGVIETPCGYGKSTWAKCHIAVNASPDNPYVYIVETVAALYKAAEDIEALNPGLHVGRAHGFNQEKCETLCGKQHTYKECRPRSDKEDPSNECNRCEAGEVCAFYNRMDEESKAAVLMTHNGFIRLLENASSLLKDTSVIIDEDLNGYIHEEFTYDELCLASELCESTGAKIEDLIPFSAFSRRRSAVKPGSLTYASEHYIYRTSEDTASGAAESEKLRAALRTGSINTLHGRSPAQVYEAKEVVTRLVNFFRPTRRKDATYAYREVRDNHTLRYTVKKDRFDLGAELPCRRLWILNASARLMPAAYPDNIPVYSCNELQPTGHNVMVHVVRGNPTTTRLDKHVEAAMAIALTVTIQNRHTSVMLATAKNPDNLETLKQTLRDAHPHTDIRITHMQRGRIKGSNEAGHCTLGFLASMPLFKTIDDYALTTALQACRTIPVSHFIKEGKVHMPGGRFVLAATREIYALSALDELYQTTLRTAVRNDRSVDIIAVIPDAEWICILQRTVMPGIGLGVVYSGEFEIDDKFRTLCNVINSPPGHEFRKKDLLRQMGYSEKTRWQDVKAQVMHILGPFFEEGSNAQVLRRKQ